MKNFQRGYLYLKDWLSKENSNGDEIQKELLLYKRHMEEVYKIDICEGWSDGLRGEELYKALRR